MLHVECVSFALIRDTVGIMNTITLYLIPVLSFLMVHCHAFNYRKNYNRQKPLLISIRDGDRHDQRNFAKGSNYNFIDGAISPVQRLTRKACDTHASCESSEYCHFSNYCVLRCSRDASVDDSTETEEITDEERNRRASCARADTHRSSKCSDHKDCGCNRYCSCHGRCHHHPTK